MEQIGPYEVLEELAQGGQGAVLKARHGSLGTIVAIKILLRADPETHARFCLEARTLARLRHPGLLSFEDWGQLPNGVPYLAMEFVRGQDLSDWVRERGLPDTRP